MRNYWTAVWCRSPRPTAGMDLVVLFSDGGLVAGVPHYYMSQLATSGIAAFALGGPNGAIFALESNGVVEEYAGGARTTLGSVSHDAMNALLSDLGWGASALVSGEASNVGYWAGGVFQSLPGGGSRVCAGELR